MSMARNSYASHTPTLSSPCPRRTLCTATGWTEHFANTLLAARDKDLARNVAKHPLLGMPGFVNDLIAGRTEHEAVERFERENRMAERAGRLSREGTLFASWLFATEGVAATDFRGPRGVRGDA